MMENILICSLGVNINWLQTRKNSWEITHELNVKCQTMVICMKKVFHFLILKSKKTLKSVCKIKISV